MQATYRTFAFTWLLATFFGIGYSLSSIEVNLPFHPLITVMILCFASSAGIFLIWYMDLMMCEKMIATALFEGLEYEEKFEWLPRINQSSNLFHSLWGYVHLKTIFYVGYFTIIFGTFGAALAFYLKKTPFWPLAPIGALIIIITLACILFASAKKANPYSQLKQIKEDGNGRI